MRTIFRRCYECDNSTSPTCLDLKCKSDEQCIQIPQSCNACANVKCISNPVFGENQQAKKPNVGAIAGGAVGGAVGLAIILFLFYKFCLKGRRQKYQEENWQGAEMVAQEKNPSDSATLRSTRESTYTVASMASSVLTRASNIIQIAYIPGVTNRSGPGSPDVLVPPVPPIPAMSPSSRNTGYSEQHFFVPDNFRNSTSTADVRSSYARTSLAPSLATTRASVASTVYRHDAIVSPLPAQTVLRGKAAVVSVKSSGSNSPTDTPIASTPPVPTIDPKHTAKPLRIQMPQQGGSKLSPSNSIRSTATLGKVRALNLTKKKTTSDSTPPKSSASSKSETPSSISTSETLVPTPRPLTEVSVASSDDGVAHGRARRAGDGESDSESDSDDHSRARRSLLRNSTTTTEISDSPTSIQSPLTLQSLQSPFADQASSITSYDRPTLNTRYTSNSSGLHAPMTPIQEEMNKRASDSNSSKRGQSPFADENRSDLR
ncbi:hypothetical protein DM02DRAFT_133663 [Periconia macrospinosa]|uniref:Membrane anchor Opy2 N-terminal domain-containing protein n=1 Tax=Periconia macrospinosa TaxID=97972 RepID=A0A2V1E391_9PLEO|nr:hypothetical protein DM02DRAFT_133663 [Periconia macrospinosa]